MKTIYGDITSIRELKREDEQDVHRYASLEETCRFQIWGPNTREETKAYIDQVLADAASLERSRYVFSIIDRSTGLMVGAGEVIVKDRWNQAGEVGDVVHPDFWGKGIATDAATLLIGFGFQELRLHRIAATCHPENRGSSRVLEKVGMTFEGCIRDHLKLKNGWRDSLLYSVLEDDWRKGG
ncbi:GNAT family N-acetyltransferase [Bacillaceae bacterium SIJ1]|uniref:GNAT family N-acetyltransferase n=1 Tax=Litoribacterium kuwaitense TaxID=1398745 RepID=UPI0013ECA3AA|nr:GNAT family N-acetyltransferase [Litoribacterium kuwaitense]NGP45716.1 GNAT family N-acetyltransferase [Litoribacterium kuwaitense]